jgi:hypothetical protein
MTKISFNAQALGIAHYSKGSNVGHPTTQGSLVPLVAKNTSVEALFEVLGFSNIKRFPPSEPGGPTKDVDP